jgi:putative tricarboxylic transport membrane protein
MDRLNRDVAAGLVLVAVAVIGILAARSIQAPVAVDPLGPKTYPEILLGILGVLGVAIATQGFRNGPGPAVDEEGEAQAGEEASAPLRTVGVLVLGVAYVTLLGPLGYLVATSAALFALLLILGLGQPVRAAVVGIGTTVFLYAFFDLLLQVPLPTGVLG